MQFLEIGITSRYHPFWPFWKMVFVFIRHACCRFGTQLSMLFLQLLPKLQLCLFFGWNKCCRFVQKIFLMLTTNVAKSHGKRSLFFHDIFMRKFSTPLHWSCCLLLSNIVKIDLISSSHFFGHRCQNWFFTLFCGFFCSHVKSPLKISAIIFHFPSIMKVVIDHFPKVFSGQLHKVKMNKSILLYDKSVSSLFVCPRISSEPWTTYDHETLHA